jgi:hypothetical protein
MRRDRRCNSEASRHDDARSAVTTWEYLIVSLPEFQPATTSRGESASVSMLNREGANGWEAVGMTRLAEGNFAVLLKRSVDEQLSAR